MPEPRLHLDGDTSIKALHPALTRRGHDVTRSPNDWMPLDALLSETDAADWPGQVRWLNDWLLPDEGPRS